VSKVYAQISGTWPDVVSVSTITRLQNISTVLMKVHARVESSGLSFSTTSMAVVSILGSKEAAQLEFEGQILSWKLINTRRVGTGT
jgi:hypothetical protein